MARKYQLEKYEGTSNDSPEERGWRLAQEFEATGNTHAIDRARFFTHKLKLDFSKVRLMREGVEIPGI